MCMGRDDLPIRGGDVRSGPGRAFNASSALKTLARARFGLAGGAGQGAGDQDGAAPDTCRTSACAAGLLRRICESFFVLWITNRIEGQDQSRSSQILDRRRSVQETGGRRVRPKRAAQQDRCARGHREDPTGIMAVRRDSILGAWSTIGADKASRDGVYVEFTARTARHGIQAQAQVSRMHQSRKNLGKRRDVRDQSISFWPNWRIRYVAKFKDRLRNNIRTEDHTPLRQFI